MLLARNALCLSATNVVMSIGKAILLSAGKGSRLLPLTAERPKCLIPFSGRSLLEWQLDILQDAGIGEIVIVTGFRDELVAEVAAERDGVRTLFNPFYHVADNLGSVWMARKEFNRDVLLLNGDTLVSAPLLARVLAADPASITVTIDEKESYDSDDMKVLVEDGRLLRIGKTLDEGRYNGESIGLLAFRREGPAVFAHQVDRMIRPADGVRRWYLRAIDGLAQAGAEVGVVSIRGEEWQEVDFPEDLAKAEALTNRWAASRELNPGAVRRATRP
jgi:choline kinase